MRLALSSFGKKTPTRFGLEKDPDVATGEMGKRKPLTKDKVVVS